VESNALWRKHYFTGHFMWPTGDFDAEFLAILNRSFRNTPFLSPLQQPVTAGLARRSGSTPPLGDEREKKLL
jgi:hypothetical protein